MISLDMEIFIYVLTGLTAGFIAGLFGVGGGLVAVPALVLTFHRLGYSAESMMQTAIGTSLAAMILTSGASAWAHQRQKGVEWGICLSLAPGVVLGAITGAVIAHLLHKGGLKNLFGAFLCMIGVYFLMTAHVREREKGRIPNRPKMIVSGFVIGILSSILGIGGGIITVPLLTFYGRPLKNSISTSAVIGFFIAIIGALSFIYLGLHQEISKQSFGYVYLPAFMIIGLTAMLTAPLGARYAYSTSTPLLKRLYGLLLLLTGISMLQF